MFYENIAAAVGFLEKLLSKLKPPSSDEALPEKEKPEQLLEEVTFEGVGKYIKEGHCEYTINTGVCVCVWMWLLCIADNVP